MIFVGDDWARDHHDVHVMDEQGARLAARRLPEGVAGLGQFHALLAPHAKDPGEVVIGIETDRGPWVAGLVSAGYRVVAVNPRAAARYRDRHHVSGAKSDAGDAKMLADLVRTDRHNHRAVVPDTDLAEAIKVLARAHQNLVWDRTRETNRMRSTLVEFYPAALDAFGDDLDSRDALAVLALAPDPVTGARLTLSQISAALKRGGRQRNLPATAQQIQTALRTPQLTAPPRLAGAYAATIRAQVAVITALNTQISALADELGASFEHHPDADIFLSLPGLGKILGARVLGEFGDNPDRFADAKSRRNYAGTSPLTIASGTRHVTLARHVRNKRLIDALDCWAAESITKSPGARAFYDKHRAAGDNYHQALRALANRWVAILHGCLHTHTRYDEHQAWDHRHELDHPQAA